ncbi:AbgT family transporter [Chitinibacteraceae bacterium HSL-7]
MLMQSVLNRIERTGNRLPDPVTLFFALCVLVVAASVLASALDWQAVHPATGATVTAVSLLSADGIRFMFTDLVKNIAGFPPLFTVIVAMLGVGVAEASGFLGAVLQRIARVTPAALLTPVVIFLGVMSNVASDVGYVVLIPLAGMLFLAAGRNPLVGIFAAFAGVSAGFSANLLVGVVDTMLGGITQTAAQIVAPTYQVTAVANYYFMMVSTGLIAVLGWAVSHWLVEPRLATQAFELPDDTLSTPDAEDAPRERRALRWAACSVIAVAAVMLVLTVPQGAILRHPETDSLLPSPLIDGLIALVFVGFFVPGVVFGAVSGRFRSDRDVIGAMSETVKSLSYYVVLVFFAAQFIAFFNFSKLGLLLAMNGAEVLGHLELGVTTLMLAMVLLTAFINLFMGSASAKWAVMAPVFVPMFMLLGVSPETTQLAYRIGDSVTNVITPLMFYMPMVLIAVRRYLPNANIGTLAATMLPYSMSFLVGWSALMVVWLALGWPIGPGVATTFTP